MQQQFSLNKLYTQYTEGLLDRRKFEGLIFQDILEDLHRFNVYHWNREDCDDFVSWLYPRLSKSIDSYRNTGASFATYVNAVVRWSAKEYRSRMADNRVAEYASWTVRIPDLYAGQTEPEYPLDVSLSTMEEPPAALPSAATLKKIPRQLLILILKCYHFVSDDFLDRIAPLAGIEKKYLQEMIDKLRVVRLKRDEKLYALQERIYCQFYRCIIYEKRLAAMPESSAAALRMQSQLHRARLRLAAMRKRLAGFRPSATNSQIAELLGVSKGTVDSSLHAIKVRWNNDPHKSILN
ncbi:MAG: hypothetical protein LBK62_10970 [Treponema sp.]|jgi:DNA-directed RNA polymerase specialized sigma24 family protein|nr:hypothetical protein [Treponema sp.]